MNTISPGLDELAEPARVELPRLRLSRAAWGAIAMALLFGVVAVWRLSICMHSVLACTR